MAVTEEALAVAMLRDQFGPIVAETARILLANPASTFIQVTRYAKDYYSRLGFEGTQRERDKKRVRLFRDAMAVLVQHDIVFSEERILHGGDRSGVDKCRVYYVRVHYALMRVRVPLYLGYARHAFGDAGLHVLQALFARGKMTSKQILDMMVETVVPRLDIQERDAQQCLFDMIDSGLVRHAGRRLKSSPREGEGSDDGDQPEVGAVGQKRPRSSDTAKENGDKVSITVGRGRHAKVVGAPRRDNDDDLWAACFWHLNRQFRNRCCSALMDDFVPIANKKDPTKNRCEKLAHRIFAVGMYLALDKEDSEAPLDDMESTEVETQVILDWLRDKNMQVTEHEFWEAVQVLLKPSPPFVQPIPQHEPTKLRFIPGRLVSITQERTIDDLIASRYTLEGRRIFRALAIEGGMEEKLLAKKCLLPLKIVRGYLFQMYKDRMVLMQEVPRSHDQTRASNWYYLWKVNPLQVYRNVNQIVYKTTLNLFLRLESMENKTLPPAEAEKMEKRKDFVRLAINRLDQMTMLLRDFGFITSTYLPAKYRVLDGPMGKVRKAR